MSRNADAAESDGADRTETGRRPQGIRGIKTETEYGKYKVCFHRGMWEHTFLLNCYGRQLYDIMKSNHIKSNDTGGFLCPERI